jgi:toxin HigB-1
LGVKCKHTVDRTFVLVYNSIGMIKSFDHKGLQLLFHEGNAKGINSEHKKRLVALLFFLNRLDSHESLIQHPKYRHELKGDFKGFYSMTVSGNWRLIFEFDGEDVHLVDYLDYH